MTKYRYFGRMVGVNDALCMKIANVSPETYYNELSEEERHQLTVKALKSSEDAAKVIIVLLRLSEDATMYNYSNEIECQDLKIGVREGMMFIGHNEELMRLTLPINFWQGNSPK